MRTAGWRLDAAIKAVSLVASLSATACTPTFDWRENQADGTGLVTTFPCRPDRHSRAVDIAGRRVDMQMLTCVAGSATFAVAFYDAVDPAAVGAGLSALRLGLIANVQDAHPRVSAVAIRGMTPSAEAARIAAEGRRPDGGSLRLRAAVFSRGLRVYQAAVVGSAFSDEAVEPFLAGMRFPA